MKTADKIKRLRQLTKLIETNERKEKTATNKVLKFKKEAASLLNSIPPSEQLMYNEKLAKIWKL